MKKRIVAIIFTVLMMLLAAPVIMGSDIGLLDADFSFGQIFSSAAAHKHSYSAATCTKPKTCKTCGAKSGKALGHKYSNACDTTCNTCKAKRTIKHTYSNSCDTTCNVCKAKRTIKHTYSNSCDTTCNVCKAKRTIKHTYSNSCDTTCNVCKAKRTIKHTYSNSCDITCNVCKAKRTIKHTYSNSCDTTCNVCKAKRSIKHTYSNSCDTSCNVCKATRKITHSYAAATCTKAKTCKVCGATSGKALGHKYTNACDTSCNTCKATRKITHSYAAATCTKPKTCKVCSATSGSKLGHKYSSSYTTDKKATCTAAGSKSKHCTRDGCSAKTSVTSIAALGHKYTNACDTSCNTCKATRKITHNYAAATCTKAKTCKVCGATSGSALGHSYAAATCTKPKTCKTCSATSGSALGHSYAAATCTKPKTCKTCSATSGSALGHSYAAATCTKPKTCKTCSATSGSALGHTEVTDKAVAATCIKTGLTEGKHCSVCSAVTVAQEEVPVAATNHTNISAVEAVDENCTEDGNIAHFKCDGCHTLFIDAEGNSVVEYNDVTIPATGHSAIKHDEIPVSCVNNGQIEFYECNNCSGLFTTEACDVKISDLSELVITAPGHIYGEPVIVNEVKPDCDTEGSYEEVYYCTVCEEEVYRQTQMVPAPGHQWSEAVTENVVKPDCVNDGSYDVVYYCTVCEDELSRETIPEYALGHAYGEPVITNEVKPDCDTEGSYEEVYYCTVCEEEVYRQTQMVPAQGHQWSEAVTENVVKPDCENDGSYDVVYYCTVCEDELSRETIPEYTLGHTVVVDAEVEATCTESGLTEGVHCSVCSAVILKQETVPATGHTIIHMEAAEPECDKDGYSEHYKCSVCLVLFADAEGKEEIAEDTVVIPSTGHEFENKYFEPSCEVGGYYADVCKVCNTLTGEVVYDDTQATGHSYEETVVASTCETDGYTIRVCSTCKGEEQETNADDPAKGHKFKEDRKKRVTATCQTNGYKEYNCQNDGCDAVKKEVLDTIACVPAEEGELVTTIPGSKNADGTTKALCRTEYRCEYCEQIVSVVENYSAHSAMLPVNNTQATCTTPGATELACSDCGFSHIVYYQEATGHSCSTVQQPNCTEDGYIVTEGHCEYCGEDVPAGDRVVLHKKGHILVGIQTCETSVYCETCGYVDAAALGHNFSKESSKTGTMVDTFFCTRCGKAESTNADKINTFNAVTSKIKTDFYPSYSDKMVTFGKIKNETTYTKFNFGIYTSMIRDMYESEMANAPDDYMRISSKQIKWNLPIDSATTVSELEANDIDSISVERLSGLDFNSVLADFNTEYTVGSTSYSLAPYKAIKVDGSVLKVTVDVRNEKYYNDIENLGEGNKTALAKLFGIDVRNDLGHFQKGTNGKLFMEENENSDGYEMSMHMTLNQLATDGKVTYYFLEETYEPIIAIYTAQETMEQDITMKFKIGVSINGTMAPIVKTTNTNVFVFPGYTAN